MPQHEIAFTLRGLSSIVWSMAFIQDDETLITGDDQGHIKAWSPVLDTPVQAIELAGGRVRGLAISPDGTTVASAHGDGQIRVWRLSDD